MYLHGDDPLFFGMVYLGKSLILRLNSLVADLLLMSMRKMNALATVKIGITV